MTQSPETSLPPELEERLYEAFFGAAGDAARDAAVEAICAEHPDAAGEIRRVAGRLDAGDRVFAPAGEEQVPEQIGPYRIGRKLGEGGFGVVYYAEQKEPIERAVALKLIRLGMDSRSVVARFEAERRALARMDHPGVARVLDAGVTEDGRPWFVMEHVPGLPITRYCDDNRLDLRARLELFTEVCDGVQHAHQRGILHRDIKPSNVLVRIQDGNAVPKIIDFGIAKALHGRDDEAERTQFGGMIGTPEFMSPEQAEMGALDVDTRTDVYSLGMLLYVLLAGDLPFERKSVTGGVAAIQQFLREHDFVTPSTRIGALSERGEIAARRRTTPPGLASALRGELDWVVTRAIDKDRTRRYETVAALADDVRRYLAGDPVVAGPPSSAYRIRKFLTKHRVPVIAAATVLVALVGGLVASTLLWLRASAAEEQASASAQQAEENAAKANAYLSDFHALADRIELGDLVREAERLWPEHPDTIPAIDAWLVRARELAAARERHAGKLAALRERSGEETAEGWKYSSRSDRFLAESLGKLMADLARFADPEQGVIPNVAARLEWSRTVERRTVEDRASEWEAAVAAVAADPRFRGLRMRPQIGLVPLGPDPRTGLQEFCLLRSGRVPLRGPDGRLKLVQRSGIVLVLLPPGTFTMGAQGEDPSKPFYLAQTRDFEGPPVEVTLDAFFISKFEMTQAQWRRWTGKNPSKYVARGTFGGLRIGWLHPVENVSWRDCERELRRLGLVLPTESQWEYACRAGTTTRYYTGDDIRSLQRYENLADDSGPGKRFMSMIKKIERFTDQHGPHAPVGSYRANPFGLHDMLGNVSEHCRDRNGLLSVEARPGDGFREQPPGRRPVRIYRGGSFGTNERMTPTAIRGLIDESGHAGPLGVRPARALDS